MECKIPIRNYTSQLFSVNSEKSEPKFLIEWNAKREKREELTNEMFKQNQRKGEARKTKGKSVLRGRQAYPTVTVRKILGEKIISKKKWLPELSGEETKITFYFVTFYTYCSFEQIF